MAVVRYKKYEDVFFQLYAMFGGLMSLIIFCMAIGGYIHFFSDIIFAVITCVVGYLWWKRLNALESSIFYIKPFQKEEDNINQ